MKKLLRLITFILLIFLSYQGFRNYQAVKQVMSYRPLVQEVLAEEGLKADEDMLLAMIFTETKGSSADVMQASESATGYANTITDSKESIRQGVTYLCENIRLANESGVDIWTAVQAYNFGPAYIDYIAQHGGENTIELAEEYSKTVVAPSLGNTNQQTYQYAHPIALLNGRKLYVNGGNFYYSRQVHFNMYLIQMMSFLSENVVERFS